MANSDFDYDLFVIGGGSGGVRAARVAAGGVAREVLKALAPGLAIKGYMTQMGELHLNRDNFDWDAIELIKTAPCTNLTKTTKDATHSTKVERFITIHYDYKPTKLSP